MHPKKHFNRFLRKGQPSESRKKMKKLLKTVRFEQENKTAPASGRTRGLRVM